MTPLRRAVALVAVAVVGLGLSSCSGGSGSNQYGAEFARAVQVFPGIKVRVLGVDVGHVTAVANDRGGVRVGFQIDDSSTKLPADVRAAVVPVSLLGERYIQLFPAYQGGPVLRPGTTIPIARTAVPAEPDELLRSLQDYLGGLDPKVVTRFVENGAKLLRGNGTAVNRLILHGTRLLSTLNAKRGDLADLIVQLDRLTGALATRQTAIGQLIRNYGAVAGTLNSSRTALEGTVTGLNDAATRLAALLLAHRSPLHTDIERLTRTGQTIARNVDALAQTGHWATRLFLAASRAVDFNHDWLRLGNQGQPLAALIVMRLEQRLMELCHENGSPKCSTPQYWSAHVPNLFCFAAKCPNAPAPPALGITKALAAQPKAHKAAKTQATAQHTTVRAMMAVLLRETVGDPYRWMAGTQ